jgi:uncharacterized protein (TIGR02271 family)
MAYEVKQGMKVKSSDGASLGKIIQIAPDHFLVEKGFFFPKDYAVPFSMLRECRDGEAWLTMSRDELEKTDALHAAAPGGSESDARGEGERGRAWTDTSPEAQRRHGTGAEGEQRMTLSDEELEARKRVKEAGDVTVRKEVTTEHKQIDVPVMKEEVHVERTPATSATPADPGTAFRDETMRVPVREEEVEITKRPRVREEVRVSKGARQEERRVEGEVRHEEARVERRGDEERGMGPGRGEPED